MVAVRKTEDGHHSSSLSTESFHIVPAGHGYAFEVKKGSHFRVIDLHGTQVVDFVAWVPPSFKERVTMAYTRYHLSGATPTIGECLYTNADRPLFRVVADTVKTHDMTFMACFPKLYEDKGLKGHRSCAANVAEAMAKYGLGDGEGGGGVLDMPDPFNIFQNTPLYTLKPLGASRAGDYIEFEALDDAVCAVSCCPFDIDGFNGGKITDIAIVNGIKPSAGELRSPGSPSV